MSSKLDAITSKLKKDYGLAIANVNESGVVHFTVTDSPNINYIFGGGIPRGRIMTLFGPESAGKTVIANYLGAQIQRQKEYPNVVLFVDMEHTFEKKYAETVGLDTSNDKFIFIHPKHGEEGFEIVKAYTETGEIGMVIWDSVAATPSSKSLGKDIGSATYGGTASVMAEGLKAVNPILSRYGVASVFLNQVRAKIGGMPGYGPQENTKVGGYALPFYSSWIARVSNGEDTIDGNETIGKQIKVTNKKSKVGIPKRSIMLDLNYQSGFNPDMEYIDFIVNLGYVKKAGAWFSSDEYELKVQGRNGLLNTLKAKPTLFDELKIKINESFSKGTILDNPNAESDDDDHLAKILDEVEADE